ncbi:MAG: hypothetical protein AAGC58_06995, partial [Asticcacaulis sp.]
MSNLDALKANVQNICQKYADRRTRSRRLFLGEQAKVFTQDIDREFDIKSKVSNIFKIPHSSINFCGSAQLGFSVHKDRLFTPRVSDLDIACIDTQLFQNAWSDIIETTRAFTDKSSFTSEAKLLSFKDMIVKRGMILVDQMPNSDLSLKWKDDQSVLSRENSSVFSKITFAIYLNEYAFCWKQDSA